jgi:hypothetical protein
MLRVGWIVLGGALAALAACSWLPSVPSLTGSPHLTNAAVEACKSKAEDAGYGGVGERQSAPTAEGGYTVTLDVRENAGYGQITCSYDPKKGAEVPPQKKPES